MFKKLKEYTFTNAVGSSGRITITPSASWSKFDFLLLIPDITVSSQSGQTSGNWLWYSISDGVNTNNNYNAIGSVGARAEKYTAIVIRDHTEGKWYVHPLDGGRPAAITSNADLSNITIVYGPYYGDTYGVFNGTLSVYGGSLI